MSSSNKRFLVLALALAGLLGLGYFAYTSFRGEAGPTLPAVPGGSAAKSGTGPPAQAHPLETARGLAGRPRAHRRVRAFSSK